MSLSGTDKRIHILGAGGHAKVVIQTARAAGWEPVGVFDDAQNRCGMEICGVPVLGKLTEAAKNPLPTVIAIGDNRTRRKIAETLSITWATIIHPTAVIDPTAQIGEGTVVCAGAFVLVDAVVGRHVIINTAASIDHDCRVDDFAHISVGCRLGGKIRIGRGTLLGVGACVKPCITVGESCVAGVGAVIVRDVPDGLTVVGVPARPLPSHETS